MPYIPEEERKPLHIRSDKYPRSAGQLNFQITDLCMMYITEHDGLSYHTINEVVGVLECAKMELYRRVAAPYEDKKRKQNGDVY